jgi:hypothetical protein
MAATVTHLEIRRLDLCLGQPNSEYTPESDCPQIHGFLPTRILVVNGSPHHPTRTDFIEAIEFGQQQKQLARFFEAYGLLNFHPVCIAHPGDSQLPANSSSSPPASHCGAAEFARARQQIEVRQPRLAGWIDADPAQRLRAAAHLTKWRNALATEARAPRRRVAVVSDRALILRILFLSAFPVGGDE